MFYIISILLLVTVDQVLKRWAYTDLQPIGSIPITNWLNLTYLENRGAAFGIMYGSRWILVGITVVILAYLYYVFRNTPNTGLNKYVRWSIVIITAGALGNFIDRILFGFVIDYLHVTFINFPIFNFADILIVTGAIAFGLFTILMDTKKE